MMIRPLCCLLLLTAVTARLDASKFVFPMGSFSATDPNYLADTPGYATIGSAFTNSDSFAAPLEGSENSAVFAQSDLVGTAPLPAHFKFLDGFVDDGGQSGQTLNSLQIDQKTKGEATGSAGEFNDAFVHVYSNTPFQANNGGSTTIPIDIALSLDATGFQDMGGQSSMGFAFYLVKITPVGDLSIMNEANGFFIVNQDGFVDTSFNVDGTDMFGFYTITPQQSVNDQAQIGFGYSMEVDVQAGETYSLLATSDLGVGSQGEGFAHLNSYNTFTVTLSSSDEDVSFNVLSATAIPEPSTPAVVLVGAAVAGGRRRR